jgi:hypothetical protein
MILHNPYVAAVQKMSLAKPLRIWRVSQAV